jgi:phospholipase/lecithinase/hemolysin
MLETGSPGVRRVKPSRDPLFPTAHAGRHLLRRESIVVSHLRRSSVRTAALLGFFVALLLVGPATSQAVSKASGGGARIGHVYCFGDSYSDNGRSLALSTKIMTGANPPAAGYLLAAPPAYWQGRWSNGPTAVEVLSTKIGAKLTDYAVGGAESSYSNYYSWLDPFVNTGLLGQVCTFAAHLKGHRADPRALYIVQMAGNDYFYYMDYALTMPGTVQNVARQVVANESEAVRELTQLGARRFLVIGSEDVALLPWEVENTRTAAAATYTETVNGRLPGAVNGLRKQLHVRLVYFPLAAVDAAIRANAAKFGLTELSTPYEQTYPAYVAGTGNPDTYFFWDEWHPTAAVHKILGASMVARLKQSGLR